MGSAYPTIAADAVARYHRLRGRPVTFITGTDEHGEKIALAAAKRGMEPKAHCDDIVDSYKALWKDVRVVGAGVGRRAGDPTFGVNWQRHAAWRVAPGWRLRVCQHRRCLCSPALVQLDIAYDSFIRTTDAKHESLVRAGGRGSAVVAARQLRGIGRDTCGGCRGRLSLTY